MSLLKQNLTDRVKDALQHTEFYGSEILWPHQDFSMSVNELLFEALEANRLRARVAELEAKVPKWISVKDSVPSAGKFIACKTDYPVPLIDVYESIGRQEDGVFRCARYNLGKYEQGMAPTHWMPLPAAPGAEKPRG